MRNLSTQHAPFPCTPSAQVEDEEDLFLPLPPRVPITIAAATVVEAEAPAAAAAPAASSSAPAATPAAAAAPAATGAGVESSKTPGSSKFVVDENENLKSTPEMRAWVWVSIAMMGSTMSTALSQVQGPEDAVALGASVFLAYVLADLGTGEGACVLTAGRDVWVKGVGAWE